MAPFPRYLLLGIDFEPVPYPPEAVVDDPSNTIDPSDLTNEVKRNVEEAAHTYLSYGYLPIYSAKLQGPFTKPWTNGRSKRAATTDTPTTLDKDTPAANAEAVSQGAFQEESPDRVEVLRTIDPAIPQTPEKLQSSLPTPSESGHGSVTSKSGKERKDESPNRLRLRYPSTPLSGRARLVPGLDQSGSVCSPVQSTLFQLSESPIRKACHTCGKKDSKQWRKGPDGPGTLCTSCGAKWVHQQRKHKLGKGNGPSHPGLEPASQRTRLALRSKAMSHEDILKRIFPSQLHKIEETVHRAAVDLRGWASPVLQQWTSGMSSNAHLRQTQSTSVSGCQGRPQKRRRVNFGSSTGAQPGAETSAVLSAGAGNNEGSSEECVSTQTAMEQAFEGFREELESPASGLTSGRVPDGTTLAQHSRTAFFSTHIVDEFGVERADESEVFEPQPISTQDLFDITGGPTPRSDKKKKRASFATGVAICEDDGDEAASTPRSRSVAAIAPLSPKSPNRRCMKPSLIVGSERHKTDTQGSFDLDQIVEQGVSLMNWT